MPPTLCLTVQSLQIGLPKTIQDPDKTWETGMGKEPVTGPIRLETEGFVGDGVADRKNHGGPDKAILAYAQAHYPTWSAEWDQAALPAASFGENLTVVGGSEADVCIGDVFRLGSAQVAISQPRQPCWKVARHNKQPGLVKRIVQTGRSGWYLRVLAVGEVQAGDRMELLERPHPEWPVAEAHTVLYDKQHPDRAALAACPALSAAWKKQLA